MAKRTNTKKFRGTSIPELSKAMHGLNSSSAASPQESREDRKRTRAVNRKTEIRFGW